MKNLFSALFLMVPAIVFAQEDPADAVNPEIKKSVYYRNSDIRVTVYDSLSVGMDYMRVKGKKTVFDYYFRAKDYVNMADDEFSEQLLFAITLPKSGRFDISSHRKSTHVVVYRKSCFCPDGGNYLVKEFHIKGKRIGKTTWAIDAEFMVTPRPDRGGTPFSKNIQGKFRLAK